MSLGLEGIDLRLFNALARGDSEPEDLAHELNLSPAELTARIQSDKVQRALQALDEVHALIAPFQEYRQDLAYAGLIAALDKNPTPAETCRIAAQLLSPIPPANDRARRHQAHRPTPARPEASTPSLREGAGGRVQGSTRAQPAPQSPIANTPSLREGAGGRVPGSPVRSPRHSSRRAPRCPRRHQTPRPNPQRIHVMR